MRTLIMVGLGAAGGIASYYMGYGAVGGAIIGALAAVFVSGLIPAAKKEPRDA